MIFKFIAKFIAFALILVFSAGMTQALWQVIEAMSPELLSLVPYSALVLYVFVVAGAIGLAFALTWANRETNGYATIPVATGGVVLFVLSLIWVQPFLILALVFGASIAALSVAMSMEGEPQQETE